MKRPLAFFALSFISGILFAKISDSLVVFAVLTLFIFISGYLYYIINKNYRIFLMVAAIIFLSGAFEFSMVDNIIINKLEKYYNENISISGTIISEPQKKSETLSYLLRINSITYAGRKEKINAKVLLYTSTINHRPFAYGQELKFFGTINSVSGRRNPGGFDYSGYLAQSGISGSVYVRTDNVKMTDAMTGNIFIRLGLRIRNGIISVIEKSLPQKHAGLLNGMLIGYKGGLDNDLQKDFSDAGISHIMAVSGANVAFIVLPLLYILKKLRVKKRTINFTTIGVLFVFILVTGFEASVFRAVIMAVTILAGAAFYREGDVYTSISFAALIMSVINPYTVFNIGFQLSYSATLSLVFFYNILKEKIKHRYIPGFAADVLASTLAVQAGVLPVSVYYFNKISLISILTNVLVVPITGVITVLGLIMAGIGQILPAVSQLLGYVNIVFLAFIIFITEKASLIPFAVIKVATPSLAVLLSYYAFVMVFTLWRKNLKIKLYFIVFLMIGLVTLQTFKVILPDEMEVVFIDVGQGDSIFIRTAEGKTVLVDGGGKLTSDESGANPGEAAVLPFLLDKGVGKLDIAIATHAHGDHIQGLFPVFEGIGADLLLIPDVSDKKDFSNLINFSENRGIRVEACAQNDVIKLDAATYIEVLHPAHNFKIDNSPLNNSSLVLKLIYKDISILLTGDIEAYAEEMLFNKEINLKADVLKVAHHGSYGSSTGAFIHEVGAGAAVISVGKNNFGHPSGAVINNFHNMSVKVFRTDESGAVILKTDGRKIKLKGFIR